MRKERADVRGFGSLITILVLFCILLTTTTMSVVSSTIAKFAQSRQAEGNMYAAGFDVSVSSYNSSRDEAKQLINLGATNGISGESSIYPGQSGSFRIDISFMSDVVTEVDISETRVYATGAFLKETPDKIDGENVSFSEALAIDNTALKFLVTDVYFSNRDEIPWENAVKFSSFEQTLAGAIKSAFGDNIPVYTALGERINKTIYVYWKWDYSISEQNDLIDSYLSVWAGLLKSDLDIDSEIFVNIGFKAIQVNPETINKTKMSPES